MIKKSYWDFEYLECSHYELLRCSCGKDVEVPEQDTVYSCKCGIEYKMQVFFSVEPPPGFFDDEDEDECQEP